MSGVRGVLIYQPLFRQEREDQGGVSVKEKLERKMKIKYILDNLEPEVFLEKIMIWTQGKNVLIEEDCMILNYGLVVDCSRTNLLLIYQVLWKLALPPNVPDQLQQPQHQPWYSWNECSKHLLSCLGGRVSTCKTVGYYETG